MKNKHGWQQPIKKKNGLNNPGKVFTTKPKEDPVIPSQKSGSLTSRTVDNPAEKIKTYSSDVQDVPTRPSDFLTTRTEVWPPPKAKTNLTTKTEVWPSPKAVQRPAPFAFNNHEWQSSCALHTSVLQWINRIADEYKKMCGNNITREIFNSIAGGDLSELEKKFFDDIEKNIKKLGLTNEAIKDNMRQNTEVPFVEFKKSVIINLENVKRSRAHWDNNLNFDANNYTLKDGTFFFSDQEKERLKERFETHLDSPVKKQFAEKVEAVEKLIAEIKETCEKNGISSVFGFRKVWEVDPRSGTLLFNKNILNRINK